jgi:hypothetical protein
MRKGVKNVKIIREYQCMDLSLFVRVKNDVLDPLSVVVKLFIYSFKPIGTKISIGNNRVRVQTAGPFQGTVRAWLGDRKNDVSILNYPAIYACNAYLLSQKEGLITDAQHQQIIRYLFETACSSFDKLKETYQGNEITYHLDQLKITMNSFINKDTIDTTSLLIGYNSSGGQVKQTIYKYLNTVWTPHRLQILIGLLHDLQDSTASAESTECAVQTLEAFMEYMDVKVSNIVGNL